MKMANQRVSQFEDATMNFSHFVLDRRFSCLNGNVSRWARCQLGEAQ